MPYKFQTDKVHLTEDQDRRIKLTAQNKQDIHNAHHIDGQGIRSLSREYKVDKRLIQFVCYPERRQHNIELRKQRGGWQQYYDKDYHAKKVKEHRRYKQKVCKGFFKAVDK